MAEVTEVCRPYKIEEVKMKFFKWLIPEKPIRFYMMTQGEYTIISRNQIIIMVIGILILILCGINLFL